MTSTTIPATEDNKQIEDWREGLVLPRDHPNHVYGKTALSQQEWQELAEWRKKLPADVLGEQLHVGSVVVTPDAVGHRIDHFKPYPGPVVGDHARRAYEHPDEHGWCATVGDHELFHVEEERPVKTAREHMDWCVERAMEYADAGDMTNAWASFGSDCLKHDGTAHIPSDLLFGMEMLRQIQVGAGAREFRDFISGWAVRS